MHEDPERKERHIERHKKGRFGGNQVLEQLDITQGGCSGIKNIR
jgi:hypothetical protein